MVIAIAYPPKNNVAFNVRAVADIVTGASINNEKGLLKPPVKNNNIPSCVRSNSKDKIVALCDKRLFVGAMKLANKLNKIDAPIAIEQYPISRFKPKKLCADTIAII